MGTYNESVVLREGISLYGGYDADMGWSRSTMNTTTINGGTTAVSGTDLALPTTVQGFTIVAAANTAASGRSEGVALVRMTGAVTLEGNTIRAGNASGTGGGSYGVRLQEFHRARSLWLATGSAPATVDPAPTELTAAMAPRAGAALPRPQENTPPRAAQAQPRPAGLAAATAGARTG